MMRKPYQIGDRIRLSALGKSRMLRGKDKRGQIVGFGQTENIIRVHFEGLDRPMSVHRSYVEPDKRAELEARRANQPSEQRVR